jgi:hypothetical protein|tara:strand:- start:221 stop:445 length:225 start_codon:yes stop_codon:yes gene_type:complete
MADLTNAAMAIEAWADFKREAAWQMVDDILDEYDLTLADLESIKEFQCIGTDDDKEIIWWIEDELKERQRDKES